MHLERLQRVRGRRSRPTARRSAARSTASRSRAASSTARTARRLRPPSATGRAPSRASSGPRIRKSMRAAAQAACSTLPPCYRSVAALQPPRRTMASDVNHRHHQGDSHGTGHPPPAPRSRPEEPLQGRSRAARRGARRDRGACSHRRDPRERRRQRHHVARSRRRRHRRSSSSPPAPASTAVPTRAPAASRPSPRPRRAPASTAARTRAPAAPQSYWQQSNPRTSYQPAPDEGFKERAGGPQIIPMGPGGR